MVIVGLIDEGYAGQWYNLENAGIYAYASILIVLVTLNVLIGVSMMNLLGYHAWLRWKGLTTYEHLMGPKKENTPSAVADSSTVVNSTQITENNEGNKSPLSTT